MNAAGESGRREDGDEAGQHQEQFDRDSVDVVPRVSRRRLVQNSSHVTTFISDTTAALGAATIHDDVQPSQTSYLPSHKAAVVENTPSAPVTQPTTKTMVIQEREHFLIFVKILFKLLDEADQPHTKQRAKRIVLECRQRNQQGNPLYQPLMDAIEVRLKRFVGDPCWRRAHLLLHHYITTRRTKGKNTGVQAQPIPVVVGGSSDR